MSARHLNTQYFERARYLAERDDYLAQLRKAKWNRSFDPPVADK
jgi:hypothetical protein